MDDWSTLTHALQSEGHEGEACQWWALGILTDDLLGFA
jgi:hypothetical protein